jgi:hypothetical protein
MGRGVCKMMMAMRLFTQNFNSNPTPCCCQKCTSRTRFYRNNRLNGGKYTESWFISILFLFVHMIRLSC